MPDVENNMDELLRKAANNYSPREGDSNWDAISARLIYKPLQANSSKQKSTVKKYLITSLLVLLFLVTGDIFKQRVAHSLQIFATNKMPAGKMKADDGAERNAAHITETVIINSGEKKENTSAKNNILTIVEQSAGNVYKPVNTSTQIVKLPQNQAPFSFPEINIQVPPLNDLPGSMTFNINKPDSSASSATVNNTTIADENKTPAITANTKENTIKKQTGFYFGLVAGASFNVVKYQGVRKPGVDIGIAAGYKISNKISIETGLLFTNKSYYSDGKYFSMKKVSGTMPQNMRVLDLEGNSQLIQIPVHFKYNLSQKKNHTIYAATGISSYILLKEKNNYHTLLNGDEQNITSIYQASSAYFAGTADIAAGYQFKTRNNANLRIEPYVQMPLKGIGVGALPVTSTGLRIGFIFPSH